MYLGAIIEETGTLTTDYEEENMTTYLVPIALYAYTLGVLIGVVITY